MKTAANVTVTMTAIATVSQKGTSGIGEALSGDVRKGVKFTVPNEESFL
jgi:hypothetical protein